MHPPHKLTSDAARTVFATVSTTDNDKEYDDNDANDTTTDNEPAMSTKTKATTAAAATKSGVDKIASGLNNTKVGTTPKAPVFTSYSTKVQDPILICTVFVDGKQWVEFDVSIAAALMCGDGINVVLVSEGWGTSLQRGVYSSFFMTRHLWKDLGDKYNKDSNKVTAHRKVCDEFKKKETSVRSGVVYGECQYIQLPCECTGLVERIYKGVVPTPITVPYPVTTNENGMEVTVEEEHIQFMLHITFRVKTVSQLEKEKKKVVEVTHTNYDIFADYDSEGSL